MSRRISWLVLIAAIAVTLAAIVYSRQLSGAEQLAGRPAQQQQQPSPPNTTEVPAESSSPADAKELCTLTAAQSPQVAGVQLGMKMDDVLSAYPGSKDDPQIKPEITRPPNKFGQTTFSIKPGMFTGSKYPGVREMSLTFLDSKLSGLTVNYEGPELKNVDELVAKFIEGTTLPRANSWEGQVGLDQMKNLHCDGFEISAFATGGGLNVAQVTLKDLNAETEVKKRRAAARAKAQEQTKP